jgi:hypothetical protein
MPACTGTTVKGVRVIDLELPVAGEHPDYTATLYNPYTYKFADYGMDGCGFYWLDSEGGVMMPEDTFVAGETYSLEMKFEPNVDNGVTTFDTSSDFSGIIDNDRDGLVRVDTLVSSKNAYIMDEFVCAEGGKDVNVTAYGNIDYTVSGNVVIVTHDKPCKLGYLGTDGKYVTLKATANSDGSYSFTAPAGVTEVILGIKGDVTGEGSVNMGDLSRLYAHIRGASILTGDILFIADVTGDGNVNMGDISQIYAHIRGKALLTWDT